MIQFCCPAMAFTRWMRRSTLVYVCSHSLYGCSVEPKICFNLSLVEHERAKSPDWLNSKFESVRVKPDHCSMRRYLLCPVIPQISSMVIRIKVSIPFTYSIYVIYFIQNISLLLQFHNIFYAMFYIICTGCLIMKVTVSLSHCTHVAQHPSIQAQVQ